MPEQDDALYNRLSKINPYSLQPRVYAEQQEPRRKDPVYIKALEVLTNAFEGIGMNGHQDDLARSITEYIDNEFLIHTISLRTAETAEKILNTLLDEM